MERTDMATPEKINNRPQTLNDQFSIASKNQARPVLPACDALELTLKKLLIIILIFILILSFSRNQPAQRVPALAFPFRTRGQDRIMRGRCAVMRANARFELSGLYVLHRDLHQTAPNCSIF